MPLKRGVRILVLHNQPRHVPGLAPHAGVGRPPHAGHDALHLGSSGTRNGKIVQYTTSNRDTMVRFLGTYKQGRLIDTAWWYDAKGRCTRRVSLASSGQLIMIGNYYSEGLFLRGTPEGQTSEWLTIRRTDSLFLYKTQEYRSGVPHGEQRYYWENGKPKEISFWANGKQQGSYRRFYENGQVEMEGNYLNGMPEGKLLMYDPAGHLRESHWYKNGSLHDTAFVYYASGIVQMKIVYKNGSRHGDEWRYDSLGKPMIYRHYTNYSQDSVEIHFYPDGKQAERVRYRSGEKNGKASYWYPNGKLKAEGEYRNDERNGKWKFYSESGKLETQTFDEPEKWTDEIMDAVEDRSSIAEESFAEELPHIAAYDETHIVPKEKQMKFLRKYEFVDLVAQVDINGRITYKVQSPMKEQYRQTLETYLNSNFPKGRPARFNGRQAGSKIVLRLYIGK